MGACGFMTVGRGKTAKEAFREAVRDAQYESGHGGYTGTIAEKDSFKQVYPVDGETPRDCVRRHEEADTFGDKWGPAGCVELSEGKYAFFGWASS